jgi:hypothetical protein
MAVVMQPAKSSHGARYLLQHTLGNLNNTTAHGNQMSPQGSCVYTRVTTMAVSGCNATAAYHMPCI